MNACIVGQEKSIAVVTRVLKNAYSGVRNPNKPIGSFVIGGSSGTGKTYFAEKLAEGLFASPASLIRINLSEFSEKHHQSRLIGSPPGWVGYGDRNQLTDKILRHPYSLILLDGIEYAHPEIMKIFLQALSNGMMTDAEGREVSLRSTIIVMTTGLAIAQKSSKKLGFGDDQEERTYEDKRNDLVKACKKKFDEDFVNRIDEFVVFDDLSEMSLKKVAGLMMSDLAKRLNQNGISVSFGDGVLDCVVGMRKSYHGANAKPIERIITRDVESIISDELMRHHGKKGKVSLETPGQGTSIIAVWRGASDEPI